jgi:hypothetical protein
MKTLPRGITFIPIYTPSPTADDMKRMVRALELLLKAPQSKINKEGTA